MVWSRDLEFDLDTSPKLPVTQTGVCLDCGRKLEIPERTQTDTRRTRRTPGTFLLCCTALTTVLGALQLSPYDGSDRLQPNCNPELDKQKWIHEWIDIRCFWPKY